MSFEKSNKPGEIFLPGKWFRETGSVLNAEKK